jgi:hypothetical protein
MITFRKTLAPYVKADDPNPRYQYWKDKKLCSLGKIPNDVQEKLMYAEKIEYDDEPLRRRCIFCYAPQHRQRYLNQQLVDLCEYHYQNMSLGKIAQQVAYLKEKEASKQHGKDTTTSKGREAKGNQPETPKTSKLGAYA